MSGFFEANGFRQVPPDQPRALDAAAPPDARKLGLSRELTQRQSAKRADRSNAAFAGARRAGASPFFPDVRANF
jgi:hypothetical protein